MTATAATYKTRPAPNTYSKTRTGLDILDRLRFIVRSDAKPNALGPTRGRERSERIQLHLTARSQFLQPRSELLIDSLLHKNLPDLAFHLGKPWRRARTAFGVLRQERLSVISLDFGPPGRSRGPQALVDQA